jgi:hypothetical protein
MPLSKERQREWMKEYRKRSKTVIPSVIPNPYLSAHLKVCPEYNVNKSGNHFEHCPYIDPLLRLQAT